MATGSGGPHTLNDHRDGTFTAGRNIYLVLSDIFVHHTVSSIIDDMCHHLKLPDGPSNILGNF